VRLLAAVAATLVLAIAAPAAAAPPTQGVLIPGRSLGGIPLGANEAEVERRWGRAYGTCRGCERPTWYFNYFAYQPRGAGVEFTKGQVVGLFTLYQPPGWRTNGRLELGDSEVRVINSFPKLERHGCGTYTAYVLRGRGVNTAFYVLDDRLWAFGLYRAGLPFCR
jgi:hypothetical protein